MTRTTTKTASTTNVKADPNVTPAEVVELLVQQLDRRLSTVPTGLQVDDLLDQAREAVGRDLPEIDRAVRDVAAGYASMARAQGYTEMVANHARGQLGTVLRVADELFSDWDDAEVLATAEATLVRLEADRQTAMDDLVAAVEQADVEAVMRLRPQVEVVLPTHIEEATARVLELQVTRSELVLVRSHDRQREVSARVEGLQQVRDKAADTLAAADRKLNAGRQAVWGADRIVGQVEQETQGLRDRRDATAASVTQNRRDRARRMAGFPVDDVAEVSA